MNIMIYDYETHSVNKNDLKAGDGNNININQEDCHNVKRYYKKKAVF